MIFEIARPLILTFLAGACTLIGAVVFLLTKKFNRSYLSFAFGFSAGAMIYLSFVELFPMAVKNLGLLHTNLAFFFGVAVIATIDFIIPHHLNQKCAAGKQNKFMTAGIITAVGIALHNFPEGAIVFLGAVNGIKSGLLIAFSTALHNVPEGIAVAIPVFLATKSKKKALFYSFLAGIAEPVGGLVSFLVLKPIITPSFLAGILAFAAGIMIYISIDELLPACFENCGGHKSITGVVMGMIIVALSISFIY